MVTVERFEAFIITKLADAIRDRTPYDVYVRYADWCDVCRRTPEAIKWRLASDLQEYDVIVKTFTPKNDETYAKVVSNFETLKTLYNYLMTGREE